MDLTPDQTFEMLATPLHDYLLSVLENDLAARYPDVYREYLDKTMVYFQESVADAHKKQQRLLYQYLDSLGYGLLYNQLYTAHIATTSRVLKEADLAVHIQNRKALKKEGIYAKYFQDN